MFSVFLQNLALISVTLLILVNHKADFLIQGFIFSLAIWYVLFSRQFYSLFG